jgi:hypothetical protein
MPISQGELGPDRVESRAHALSCTASRRRARWQLPNRTSAKDQACKGHWTGWRAHVQRTAPMIALRASARLRTWLEASVPRPRAFPEESQPSGRALGKSWNPVRPGKCDVAGSGRHGTPSWSRAAGCLVTRCTGAYSDSARPSACRTGAAANGTVPAPQPDPTVDRRECHVCSSAFRSGQRHR